MFQMLITNGECDGKTAVYRILSYESDDNTARVECDECGKVIDTQITTQDRIEVRNVKSNA